MSRRPYRRPMARTWFLERPVYLAYLLREGTSLVLGLWTLHAILALVFLRRGPEAWEGWLALQTHPLAVALHGLALVAALYHSATWFRLTPLLLPRRIGRRRVRSGWVTAAHWGLLLAVSVAIFWWALPAGGAS